MFTFKLEYNKKKRKILTVSNPTGVDLSEIHKSNDCLTMDSSIINKVVYLVLSQVYSSLVK